MKTLLRHILIAFFLTALLGGTASAMPGHTHHGSTGSGDTLSPFNIKHEKRLHCELLGHNPLLPCPHQRVPAGKNKTCFLTNDCGGGPFPVPTSRSAADFPRFVAPSVMSDGDISFLTYVLTPHLFYDASIVSSLDRPPQAL